MTFRPLTKAQLEEFAATKEPDEDLEKVTAQLASVMVMWYAQSLDQYPEQGAISFRCPDGGIYEMRLVRSDAKHLKGELNAVELAELSAGVRR